MITLEEFHRRNVELCQEMLRNGGMSPQVTLITDRNEVFVFLWEYVKEAVPRPLFLLDFAIEQKKDWCMASFICSVSTADRLPKNYRPGLIQRLAERKREMWVITVSKDGRHFFTRKSILGEDQNMTFKELH
jgi:hypothetical protein